MPGRMDPIVPQQEPDGSPPSASARGADINAMRGGFRQIAFDAEVAAIEKATGWLSRYHVEGSQHVL